MSAPSYSDESYWQDRFLSKSTPFEWLHDGKASLVRPLLDHLDSIHHARHHLASSTSSSPSPPSPRVLHIGVGSSKLSLDLLSHYRARGWDPKGIVNWDFAQSAIQAAIEIEKEFSQYQPLMSYHRVDLLSWPSVSQALGLDLERDLGSIQGSPLLFDAILDKSTTDSISTGVDLHFTLTDAIPTSGRPSFDDHLSLEKRAQRSPALKTLLSSLSALQGSEADPRGLILSPVHILSLHLADLTRKGSRWFVLSYSASRFRDVLHFPERGTEETRWPWQIDETAQVEAVDLPQSQQQEAQQPPDRPFETANRCPAEVDDQKTGRRRRRRKKGCKDDQGGPSIVHTPSVCHWFYCLSRI
ncbi:hypothetical protein IE53DRAFT_343890 [Violaceomyces palustris]|uniref:Uncharacterized protein n=1 Tax=Violaceomyces palustris TaxID=1673888 RepID=A0ACD0NXM9_9BASI|nr:hypothetical protein IE53DRAFT_343890 [Violaceomyces palustris]